MITVQVRDIKISYNENSTQMIVTAVEELKLYLEKCEKIPFTQKIICLGSVEGLPEQKDIQRIQTNDGYLLKTYGEALYICGKTDVGTLFGTYRFIEKYIGVEWLTPDCDILTGGEEIPADLDEVFDFSAFMRFSHCYAGLNPIYRARQRMNYTVGDINDKPSYGGLRGIKFAFSWGLFGHTFEVLLPYEKYYDQHPEWYSFAEGHYGENHRYQICLTNPEVFDIVLKNILDYLEQYPDCKIVSVSQNDAYNDFEKNYCRCDGCRKIFEEDGSYSAVLLQFVNRIAKRVKETHPDVFVHTFAYHFTEDPPKTIVPEDNVIVQFCLHLPYGYSITEDTERSNKERNKYEGWKKICKHMFVWTYVCYHAWYFSEVGNFKSLYDNTVYFLQSGAFGLFQQGNHDYSVGDFCDLRNYLTAKMFQNPSMTYEEYCTYMQTYLNGYYGEAGKYIYEYIWLLDKQFHRVEYGDMTLAERVALHGEEDFVLKGRALYEKAAASVSDPILVERLQKNRLQFEFCELCYLYEKQKTDESLREEYERRHRAFFYAQKEYGVTMYRENGRIPDLSRIDFTKMPLTLTQADKTIPLKEGERTATYCAQDSTSKEAYGFDFAFSVFGEDNVLQLDIEVQDKDVFLNSEHMESWEQDCVEIYVSEGFNRTNIRTDGDYTYRVNADGAYYTNGHDDKIESCVGEKTEGGYKIRVRIRLQQAWADLDKIGFEIMVHDFNGDGKYIATRYWNALKFSPVSDCPNYYGIIEVKK